MDTYGLATRRNRAVGPIPDGLIPDKAWADLCEEMGAWLSECYPLSDPTPARVATFVIAWLSARELIVYA